ncbi:hypothetical protein ACOMHN_038234 [Nucella lapillus]
MMNRSICHSFLRLAKSYKPQCACRGFSFTSRHYRVKICYEVYPEGSNLELAQEPPIFILHGMFGSKLNWHSLAQKISSETHRQVVTLDARNHGDSEHAPVMDYLTMRDDLLGVMDKLKVEQSILVGHSMGGKTVMSCALTVPERVSSLIVVDTAPKDSPGSDGLKVYAQKMKAITMPPSSVTMPEARRQVGDQMKAFVEEEGVRRFLLTNLKQAADNTLYWRVNLDAIIDNFESLHSFPQFSTPSSIKTIFIGGAKSQHVDSTAEPAIHRLFPGTTIERIPQAGHWVHSEKPAEVVRLVKEFVLS